MNWIAVNERVPDTRRKVLAWGDSIVCFPGLPRRSRFLGETRFNSSPEGGRFDIERTGGFASLVVYRVTHWCEIVGPAASNPMPAGRT